MVRIRDFRWVQIRLKLKSADDFERLMLEVDQSMQERNIPIPGRELAALGEVAKRLRTSLYGGPAKCEPIPGNYTGRSLTGHVYQWIQQRYGDRLRIDMIVGESVALIRGDPWILRLPDVLGGPLRFVAERDLGERYPESVINRPGQPREWLIVNVLRCIKELPSHLAAKLTDAELAELFDQFIESYLCLRALKAECREQDLAIAARIDLTASARHILAGQQEFGMSRWASLQAAEKLLKLYLSLRGVSFPKVHLLTTLFELVAENGLPMPPVEFIASLQISASARYEQQAHTAIECVIAHRSAIRVGVTVMHALFPEAMVATQTRKLMA